MATKQGRINYQIGFTVDKTSLNDLKTSLQHLQNLTVNDLIDNSNLSQAQKELKNIKSAAAAVEEALEKSFNVKLNSTNLSAFNKALTKSGYSVADLANKWQKAGTSGQQALLQLSGQLLTTNKHVKETSKWLDKMAETMSNTIRWSVASTALNSLTGQVQRAYGFTKDLDKSLNDIMIVTEKSADSMAKFAKQATAAAKNLGSVTTDYTKASLIYYQQGLSDQEVAARAETTIKVANVTKQSANTVSEQLTAVWNGYKTNAQEAELYIDKLSAVAARTAADLEELSVGMSRVASAANIMGVDIDQLNAQLATIVSVTREAPESIGTALKTVYARMSDIEAGLDSETSLGEYTKQMAEMGIKVLDAKGNLRDMGAVVEEIGEKWNTFNRNQQVALAQSIAGTRQYSRMMALFDNWNMYESAKEISEDSAGTLQKQQDIYIKSMEAHLNKLQTEAEDLYQSIFNAEDINPLIDALTKTTYLVKNLIDSIGGGRGLLALLGTTGINLFGDKISSGLAKTVRNIKGLVEDIDSEAVEQRLVKELDLQNSKLDISSIREIVEAKKEQLKIEKFLTKEQKEQHDNIIRNLIDEKNKELELRKSQEQAKATLKGLGVIRKGKSNTEILASLANKTGNLDIGSISEGVAKWQDILQIQTEINKQKNLQNRYSDKYDNIQIEFEKKSQTDITGTPSYKLSQELDRLQEIQLRRHDSYLNKQKEINRLQETRNNLARDFSKEAESTEATMISQASILRQTQLFNPTEVARLKEIERILSNLSLDGLNEQQTQEKIKEINKAMADLLDYSKRGTEGLGKVKKTLQEGDAEAKKLKQSVEGLSKASKEFTDGFSLELQIDKIVNLTGKLTNLITGWQMLSNIDDIWTDEQLSAGEKFGQILSNITMSLPMLISGLGTLKPLLNMFKASSGAANILNTANSLAAGKYFSDSAKDDLTSLVNSANLSEKQRKALLKQISKRQLAKEDLSTIQDLALQNSKNLNPFTVIGSKVATGAKGVAKGAVKGLGFIGGKLGAGAAGAAGTGVLGTGIGASAVAAGGVAVAAAAALGVAIYATVKAYNKQADALKDAKVQQELVNKSLSDARTEYSQLKSAVESYANSQKALEELTKGTTEWKQALFEANQQVIELLQNYPELQEYLLRDQATGALTIDEEGLQKVQEQQLNKLYANQNASIIANQNVRQAQIDYDKEMLQRETSSTTFQSAIDGIINTTMGWTGLSDLWGWTQEKVTPVENSTLGFWSRLSNGENIYKQNLSDKQLDDILALEEDIIANSEKFTAELEKMGVESGLIDSVIDATSSILSLKDSIDTNNQLLISEYSQLFSNKLLQQGYSESDSALLGGMLGAETAEDKKVIEALEKEIRKKKGNNQELIKAWAKETMGLDLTNADITESGGGKFKVLIDGEEKVVTYDSLAKELAKVRYLDAKTSVSNLLSIKKTYTALAGETNDITREAINSILTNNVAITADTLDNFNMDTVRQLRDKAKAFEYILTAEQKSALETSARNLENSFINISKEQGWSNNINNKLLTLFGGDLTNATDYRTLLNTGTALNRFEVFGGQDMLAELENFFTTLGEDRDSLINAIDWTSNTLGADLENQLKDLNLINEENREEYEKLISTAARLSNQIEITAKAFGEITEILSNLVKIGDRISKDNYDALINRYTESIGSYFTLMEDGTYALLLSAQEFNKEVRKKEIDHITSELARLGEAYSKLNTDEALTGLTQIIKDLETTPNDAAEAETFSVNWGTSRTYSREELEDYRNIGKALNDSQFTPQEQAIDLLKMFLDTRFYGNKGALDLFSALEEAYGKDYAAWDFTDIIESSEGERFTVDTKGKFGTDRTFSVGYSDWANQILNIYDAAAQEVAGRSHTEAAIRSVIAQLIGSNIMTDEAAKEFLDTYLTADSLKIDSVDNQSEASRQLLEIIKAAQSGGAKNQTYEQIAAQAQQYLLLSGATFDTAYDYEDELKEIFGSALDDKQIEDIINQARGALRISDQERQEAVLANQIGFNDSKNQILENSLRELQDEQEGLYGELLLDNIQAQNEVLQDQIELLEERKELNKETLEQQTNWGKGIINEEGKLIGATTLETQLRSLYGILNPDGNSSTDTIEKVLNSFGIQEIEDAGDYFELLTEAEKKLQELEGQEKEDAANALEQVKAILDPIFSGETENELLNKQREEYENLLKSLEIALQNELDPREDLREYQNFLREINQDDEYYFEKVSSYVQDINSYQADILTYQAALTELKSKELKDSDEIIKREEYINGLRQAALDMQSSLNSMVEEVINYQNAVTKSYQEQTGLLNNVINTYEHLISLNELIYGEKAIRKTSDYYDMISIKNKSIMEIRKNELESATNAYNSALESGNETLIKSAQETYIAANQSYQDAILEYAQSAQEAFYKSTEKQINEFMSTISKYKEEWDWTIAADEDFLDEFDRLTGISKIEAAFNEQINKTTNLNAQKKLNEVKEQELELLREKDKLTQYDLDRANKRLEIEQARIALEEAQQNKTQTRLTRGLDGTYSYEYVTDQDSIDKKRLELEELQNDLVHLDEEKLENSLSQAYDLYAEFMKNLEALIKNGGTQEEIDALYSRYSTRIEEMLGYVFDEKNSILAMMNQSIDGMNALLGTNIDIEQIFEGFDSDFVSTMRQFVENGFTASIDPLVQELKEKQEEFNKVMTGEDGENGLLKSLKDATIAFDQAIGDDESGMYGRAIDATDALEALSTSIWGEDGSGGVIGSIKEFTNTLAEVLKGVAIITNPNQNSSTENAVIDSGTTSSASTYSSNTSSINKMATSTLNTDRYFGDWVFGSHLAPSVQREPSLNGLNAVNILNTTDTVRNLQLALDGSIAARMAEMANSYNNLMQTWEAIKDQVIEQNIQIQAEFPNVTEKSEIEEAFEELVNMATQRAFTSKK